MFYFMKNKSRLKTVLLIGTALAILSGFSSLSLTVRAEADAQPKASVSQNDYSAYITCVDGAENSSGAS